MTPVPDITAVVTEAWCAVLEIDDVSPEDNFFVLGGNSLAVAMLIHRVQETLGIELAMDDVLLDGRLASVIGRCEVLHEALPGQLR
ncbi:phosphopantetheine-binding protein [Micromonospora sp. CPCC 206060]|uniref:phosphopantetheine-binding protein n=1 Tax=Micromonospora sp. CPCC 206060 TaxID=3122406 RepID=UPI002FF25801